MAFPGGHVEQGEDDVSAAKRECVEEIGVDLSAKDLFTCMGHLDDL